MSIKGFVIEHGIRKSGGIQEVDFITAAGNRANRKVEMDVLSKNRWLRWLVAREVAIVASSYGPDLIVPVPHGVDELGRSVAKRLNVDVALLEWIDKRPGHRKLRPVSTDDASKLQAAQRIVELDDVFTTGSSLEAVSNMEGIQGKVQAGIVIWDRSDPLGQAEAVYPPVRSIVQRHIPLLVEERHTL